MGRFLEPPLFICVIMARLKSIGISPVFREALYNNWRGWARLLLHCLRRIAGTSRPIEVFCEIVFIASMMSSLVILMSNNVFGQFIGRNIGRVYRKSSWRGWARLLPHCLRRIAGD